MWSHLVSYDSYGSIVLVVMCDDSRKPLGFGLLSEYFHSKALKRTSTCRTKANITHITNIDFTKHLTLYLKSPLR